MGTYYVAGLFSVCGGVAKACRRLGVQPRSWDVTHGERYGLTTTTAQV